MMKTIYAEGKRYVLRHWGNRQVDLYEIYDTEMGAKLGDAFSGDFDDKKLIPIVDRLNGLNDLVTHHETLP